MTKILNKLIFNQLVSGSFVLFVGSMFVNLGAYLFHLLMGRMLGPSDYGVFASLNSLTYLFGIPIASLSLVVIRYVAFLKGKGEIKKISFLYDTLNRRLIVFGLLSSFVLLLLSPLVDKFLHLGSLSLIWITILGTLVSIYLTFNLSVLQGFLKFKTLSWLSILQILVKLVLSVSMVLLGLKVWGPVNATLISTILCCVLSYYFVKPYLSDEKEKGNLAKKEFINYAIPVFFSSLAFTSIYMTDVVLAKHFLNSVEAGYYASLSTLGKIIFFASSPITMALFPLASEKHGAGERTINYLWLSFGLVFAASAFISGIYYFFPELMVTLLFGRDFISSSANLFSVGIFLSFYSLCYLLVNFYLSIKKIWVVAFPVFFSILQIIMIFVFHQNITQIIQVNIIISGLLLITLLLYCFVNYVQEKRNHLVGNSSRLQAGKNDN